MNDDQAGDVRPQPTAARPTRFTRTDRDGERTLTIVGEIDIATKTELDLELADLLAEAHSPACVDLGGVSFMDSTAINALLLARRAGVENGTPLVVTAASVPARRVLEICGVWELLQRSV